MLFSLKVKAPMFLSTSPFMCCRLPVGPQLQVTLGCKPSQGCNFHNFDAAVFTSKLGKLTQVGGDKISSLNTTVLLDIFSVSTCNIIACLQCDPTLRTSFLSIATS